MKRTDTHFVLIRAAAALAAAAAGLACSPGDRSRSNEETGGTVVIAATSDPNSLFPPLGFNLESRQTTELIYEYLADVGTGMNTVSDTGFVKEIASSWSWSPDSMRISFKVNPAAKWQDGRPVTAHDVVFSFSVYTDTTVSSSTLSSLRNIDSVSAPDPATATFWLRRRTPRAFYEAASQMLILPSHVLERVPRDSLKSFTASHNPVGSGKYQLFSWNKGSSVELRAVHGHYRGRAGPERVIWSITPEYQAAVTSLLAGAADVFPNMRKESIDEVRNGGKFNLISLAGMDYVFLELNLRRQGGTGANEIFASRDVRRALTMALDRRAMVTSLFDTLAAVSIGPTVRAYPTTDTAISQLPFDTAAAGRLLDSLGWKRSAATGMRSRNGRPFRFTVIVPVSSLSRVRMAVMMQDQLRKAGIEMKIEQMDFNAFSNRQAARTFDAALASWHLGSDPGSLVDTWTTSATKADGVNFGGYTNPRFDALVDSALAEPDVHRSREYFLRANQMIVDDAPAVWLYEPKTVLAVASRIRTVPMRPSAWWLSIPDWRIPPAKRIERDAPPPPR